MECGVWVFLADGNAHKPGTRGHTHRHAQERTSTDTGTHTDTGTRIESAATRAAALTGTKSGSSLRVKNAVSLRLSTKHTLLRFEVLFGVLSSPFIGVVSALRGGEMRGDPKKLSPLPTPEAAAKTNDAGAGGRPRLIVSQGEPRDATLIGVPRAEDAAPWRWKRKASARTEREGAGERARGVKSEARERDSKAVRGKRGREGRQEERIDAGAEGKTTEGGEEGRREGKHVVVGRREALVAAGVEAHVLVAEALFHALLRASRQHRRDRRLLPPARLSALGTWRQRSHTHRQQTREEKSRAEHSAGKEAEEAH
eukprot:1716265-Rhodomonas_salina.1